MEKKILFYAYGNVGRQDDGLGVKLGEELETWCTENDISNVDFDSNYQLNIEDADNIKDYDIVIFADASIEPLENFQISRIVPSSKVEFTMHAVSPSFVVDLCQQINNRTPDAFLIHLKGYEWEFMQDMTEKARENLSLALEYSKKMIQDLGLLDKI